MTYSTPTPLAPISAQARVHSVDVLRGIAVLGILAMNIIAFALPSVSYMTPMDDAANAYAGGFTGWNKAVWFVQYMVFDQKLMTIFSMLFGAGLVLMDGRAVAADPSRRGFAAIYYRRLAWLLLFGLIHAYLFWFGDILTAYALCGLLLYPLRKLSPARLIAIGIVLMCIGALLLLGMGFGLEYTRGAAEQARQAVAAGRTLTQSEQSMLDMWATGGPSWGEGPEGVEKEVIALRGPWIENIKHTAVHSFFMQLFLLPLQILWHCGGLMLIGMGLMKMGVFSAARSTKFYGVLAAVGLAIGWPLAFIGARLSIENKFDMVKTFLIDGQFNYFGSFFAALGYTGLVMLWCKTGGVTGLKARFAAVGRMAFTNYLMQTLICTFIFYGWGLGYFASFERWMLPAFVIGVWAIQLILSPIILARWRMGPMEWVWRSLTYWKVQPMRRDAPIADGQP